MSFATEPVGVRAFAAADARAVEPWLDAPGLMRPPGSRRRWAERLASDPRVRGFVAECAGRPLGFLRYDPGPDGVAELTIAVAPTARRRGVGRALVAAALQLARAGGLRALDAAIDLQNAAALAFFGAHGFERERPCGDRLVLRRLVHTTAGAKPLDIG
ncbi:MAG: GNAT family N-acetyltransferase [Planctomycetes bacterium]|nr:GNAT family N-acetyltransferase [Planctomycetota bacterium]